MLWRKAIANTFSLPFSLSLSPDAGERSANKNSPESRQTGSGSDSRMRSRPASVRAEVVARKRREMKENLEEAAMELLAHFNHRNLDALLKVTRYTLEGLRKRITTSSMVHYIGGGWTGRS